MSEDAKKTLLFIKAPEDDLKSIEAFLSKRNFVVYIESDLKEALTILIENSPDFIFLAWDHPNPMISSLPKLMAQATTALTVPFVKNSSKDSIFKLNFCPINPKLYPPISGPSIERLILKQAKMNDQALQPNSSTNRTVANTEATGQANIRISSQMKANLLANFENQSRDNSSPVLIESNQEQFGNPSTGRIDFIQKKNELLTRAASKAKQTRLSENSVTNLKNTFDEKIKKPLQDILQSLTDGTTANGNNVSQSKSNETSDDASKAMTIINNMKNNNSNLESSPEGYSTPPIKTDGVIIEKGIGDGRGIAYMGETSEASQQNSQTPVETTYCMSIYSDAWCGYLFITTDASLDFSTVDLVFSEWLKLQLDGLQESDEYDFFEITALATNDIKNLLKDADFYETANIDNYQLSVGFFPVSSDKMFLTLNDDKSLIQVNTEDIPSESSLNFSLHLHLPENKKILMYTPVHKSLTEEQKTRLLKNNVKLLYTPIDYEKEIKKFMAEKNLREIYESLHKKLTVS